MKSLLKFCQHLAPIAIVFGAIYFSNAAHVIALRDQAEARNWLGGFLAGVVLMGFGVRLMPRSVSKPDDLQTA